MSCHIRKQSAYAKPKAQICCAVTAQLISAVVFVARLVQFIFFLNLKFQSFSLFLCLFSSVCVGLIRKPHCLFSHVCSKMTSSEKSVAVFQGIVIATGEKSEFGEIFKMMQCEEVGIWLFAPVKHRHYYKRTLYNTNRQFY